MEAQIKSLMSAVSTLIALQVVTLAVVAGTMWYTYHDLRQRMATISAGGEQRSVPDSIDEWEVYLRKHNATQGRTDASVVIVEYSDFQCPFCKQYTNGTRRQIVAKYGDNVRMVFKHFPLEQIHPQAMMAAIAAQCAQREGKFWETHERLFDQQDALDLDAMVRIGESLGLSNSYAECVRNEQTRTEVEQDIADALAVGVQGTPTFMINGKFLVGVQSEAAFGAVLKEAGLVVN